MKPHQRIMFGILILGVGLPLLATAGCGDRGVAQRNAAATVEERGPSAYPYRIATTVGMITNIVRQVAGEKATVTGIIGEAVDPHLFRPGRNDVATLMGADVVFYNGLLLEGKMSDTLVNVAAKARHVYQVTQLIDEKYLLEPDEFAGHFDPHVWMDVEAWMKAAEAVVEKLAQFDVPNAAHYQGNADRYLSELSKLEVYARETIGTIPKAQRVMITAHDAFNYFGRAYDIEVWGIQGLSTESEAGLERINHLVDRIVQRRVKAVFAETSVSDKNIRALIEGAADRGVVVKEGGKLFSDAMGRPGTYRGTYIGMIDHNVTTVALALGGQAPPGGMQGKLSDAGP